MRNNDEVQLLGVVRHTTDFNKIVDELARKGYAVLGEVEAAEEEIQ